MKIRAVAIGTRGDVSPLIELGVELQSRGHDFALLTYEAFRPLCQAKGIPYLHVDGEADRLMKLLVTDYKTSLDFVIGCKTLYRECPHFMDQVEEAIQGSDVVMYGTCSGLVRHVCDYLRIPCIRYFYSPMDRTDLYSLYTSKRNCKAVGCSYSMIEIGMNFITLLTGNSWRKKKGMKSWGLFSDYRKQNGVPILTFYPTSQVFMPQDPSWGKHINVTGYFFHLEEEASSYVPSKELEDFLKAGPKPIFVCFGKAKSKEMAELQNRTIKVISSLSIRAIVQADLLGEQTLPKTILRVGEIPYSYIFPRVKGVVHHGGNSTCGTALWAKVPSLVLPLALDQYFYGRAIAEANCGPAPLYWRKRIPSEKKLKEAILSLVNKDYSKGLEKMASIVRKENGCLTAAKLIESWPYEQYWKLEGEKHEEAKLD